MAHMNTSLKLCLRSVLLSSFPRQCTRTDVRSIRKGHISVRKFSSREIVPGSTALAQDALFQALKSAASVSKVFEVVEWHHKEMDGSHTLEALKCIFELHKSGCTDVSKADIVNGLVFPTLCKKLKYQAREYHLNDTIEVLKIVTYMGVPTSSMTVQILLQLIRQQINDLSLQSILFLDFMLGNLSSCPLVDALRIALPLVCQSQLATKLDATNPGQVADVLAYASRKNFPQTSVDRLLQAMDKFKPCELELGIAKKVVWSMCRLRHVDSKYNGLLHSSLKVLSENVSALKFQEVEYTLHKLTSKVRKKPEFYNGDFADSCGRYVVMQDCGFEKAVRILQHLLKLNHVCIDLLDYTAQKLMEYPKLLEETSMPVIMVFVNGLSVGNYKPENWIPIKNAILSCPAIQKEKRFDLPWFRFALDLAYLDCFSDILLKRIFSEDFLDKILAREYNFLDLLQLLTLHQAVFTLHPSYSGPLPPRHLLEKAASQNGGHMKDFPLRGALEVGLGGDAYVQTGGYTKLGHFIDHIVVMRKGGFPIAINQATQHDASKRVYVEELVVPADSQVVLVLCHPQSCYAVNCGRLKGYYVLIGKTLDVLGYAVVHINLKNWTSIPDREKIPYLMQKVRLQCEAQSDEVHALQ